MSEWTAGPRVDFQMLKDTIIGLQERIGVLEEQTHRYDKIDKRLDDLEATQQPTTGNGCSTTTTGSTTSTASTLGCLKSRSNRQSNTSAINMKLKPCGAKSDGIDEHTCMNPPHTTGTHLCECGEEWSVVRRREQRTAAVVLTEGEYREPDNVAEAVAGLREKLERYGPADQVRIGTWVPTFQTVDGIMCPAWILRGSIEVDTDG